MGFPKHIFENHKYYPACRCICIGIRSSLKFFHLLVIVGITQLVVLETDTVINLEENMCSRLFCSKKTNSLTLRRLLSCGLVLKPLLDKERRIILF